MYDIAICDDEIHICEEIKNYLQEYSNANNMKIEIDIFYTGEDFECALDNNSYYDIVFLDIELITVKGIEIAHKIREDMDNEIMQIIYISSKEQYAMELFKTRPMDFLIKPLAKEKVIQDLLQAVKIISKGNEIFECKAGHNTVRICYKDILYFQSIGRKIVLVAQNQTMEFYDKMDFVVEQIKSVDFIRVHKSYFVNQNYISNYSYENLKMKNGFEVPISKKYRPIVKQELLIRRSKKNDYRVCD